VASLELLDSLSTGASATTTLSTALGTSRAETKRQLSAATTRGFIHGRTTTIASPTPTQTAGFAHPPTTELQELHRLQETAVGP
jgi:hypothetical protein